MNIPRIPWINPIDRAIMEREAREETADLPPGTVTRAALAPEVAAAAITRPAQLARLLPLPDVMASPPTVTIGVGNAASAITNGVQLQATYDSGAGGWKVRQHRDWRYLGAPVIVKDPLSSANRQAVIAKTQASTASTGPFYVEFLHWGSQFELNSAGNAGSVWRLMVDGEYVQAAPYASVAANSQYYRHLVDFGGVRKIRRIMVEMQGSMSFNGLTIGPTDTVWTPTTPVTPQAILLADSYGGTGSDATFTAFGPTLGKLLGIPWMQIAGTGGSGYAVPGTGLPYGQRVATDIVAHNPDLVFVYGSQNDTGAAGLQAAALATHQAIRAGLPNAQIIVITTSGVTGSPGATTIQNRDAVRQAAIEPASGVSLTIDLIGGPAPYSGTLADYVNVGLFRGTGKVSTPTGSGNNDEFYGGATGTDGFHPTQAGHDALAFFIAQAVAEWQDAGQPRAEWRPGVGLVRL